MTRRETIYNIIRILTKADYTDDSRLDPDYIGYKIDEGRSKEIRDSYDRKPMIDPIWLQDYGIVDVTPVNYADDKSFSFLTEKIGKVTLPPVVSFSNGLAAVNNLGVYSLRSVFGTDEYFFKSHSRLIDILNDFPSNHPMRRFSYYTKLHNAIYAIGKDCVVPEKLHPLLILESPLDGYVLTTENVTTLIIGTVYDVIEGVIVHDSVSYMATQSFTATATTFTGSGLVQYHNQKRRMTNDDEYPFSTAQMEILTMKLLTQEYGIEASKIADLKNDSQDASRSADIVKQ